MILAACAALVVATPVAAEPLRLAQVMEPGAVPPYEVLTIVRSAGFDPLGQPFRRGPNYVLRAVSGDDQMVRVVVNAHRGDIVRVVPIASASAMPPPRGGISMGPYERMEPAPGYLPPRTAYRGGPPVVDEDDEPMMENDPRAPRPPGAVPGAPPRADYAPPPPRAGYAPPPPPRGGGDIQRSELPPPSGSRVVTASPPPPGEPHVITATEPDRNGMLPPPPERFPQRAVAPVKPKPPVKRDVASIPKQPQAKVAPLPKPRPAQETTAAAAPALKGAPAAATPPAAAPSKTESAPAASPPASEPPHDASKALPN
jgi:hypothetical protein